jgi:pyrimidine nucleoside transport protein
MPVVIFFSSTISILYYLGVMQVVILKIAWVMQRTMGTTAAESVNAAGNIFIGIVSKALVTYVMVKNDFLRAKHHFLLNPSSTI